MFSRVVRILLGCRTCASLCCCFGCLQVSMLRKCWHQFWITSCINIKYIIIRRQDSIVSIVTALWAERSGFKSWHEKGIFLLSKACILAWSPPIFNKCQGCLFPEINRLGVGLTTCLHPVLMLRMRGAISPIPL